MIEKDEQGFLSRWSRKKSEDERVEQEKVKQSEESKPIENFSELDEQPLPLWQQKDLEPNEKRQALATLFKQPEFKAVDHMNEYDEDFTSFKGLGGIVTQEMKRMLRLAEEKTRPEENEFPQDSEITVAHDSNNENVKIDNNEEDKLA